jgi:crotonobetainyl-CoA:carnitine CoA-transferase CaiB-like acyl-CoA transferase
VSSRGNSSSGAVLSPELPLAGIRVVELGENLAGPYATLVLSQLGAEVIKVERPGTGDATRSWAPPFWQGESVMFAAMNAGKRSIVLDLEQPTDRERLLTLVDSADVVVESLRPGVLARRGLGAEALRARRPELIHCAISGFGNEGPLATDPGFDPILQAFSGIMSLTGEPDAAPVRLGISAIDMGTGMWAVLAIQGALLARARTGEGSTITTSLLETGLAWLPYQIPGFLATGVPPRPTGTGLAMLVPYQAFPTADRRIMIAAGNDALWRRLCTAIERPDLLEDEDLATNPQRVERRELVVRELTRALAVRTAIEWQDILRSSGVPCSLIQDIAETVVHPQVTALEMIVPVPHPRIADFTLTALPFRVDGTRPRPLAAPPDLGELP